MTAWPDKKLIRIIRGTEYEEPIHDSLAIRREPEGMYFLISGPRVNNLVDPVCTKTDSIDEWEEVIPVPAADLKRLRDEFRGSTLSERRLSALLKVTSSLKFSAQYPLGRAVARVEALLEGPKTLLDTSSEVYLSLLLGSLATFQGVEHGPRPQAEQVLATIVRICVQWVAEVAPSGSRPTLRSESEVLAEVRSRVESDPAVGGFPAMASLAGDAAAWVDEARETSEGRRRLANGLAEPVLTIAHYALALLAEGLEGGK